MHDDAEVLKRMGLLFGKFKYRPDFTSIFQIDCCNKISSNYNDKSYRFVVI